MPSIEQFRDVYECGLREQIERKQFEREAAWTEAMAVGDRVFVERAACDMQSRSRFEYESVADDQTWAVRDPLAAYGAVSPLKTCS